MMASDRDSNLTVSVTIADAFRRVRESFASTGMPEDLALIAAEAIVETEAHGISTHGLTLLPKYLRQLESGEVNPLARPVLAHRQGAVARVDGKNALGHLGAMLACETAQGIASELGIGMVAVGGSNHAGSLAHYARFLCNSGQVGLIFATSIPSMLPSGGRARVLGNNPMAVGIPTRGAPVVLDMAMSKVARRHISLAAERSEEIPDGWAVDSQGVPTNKARDALLGSLESFGGFKATGLGVVVGMLASGFGGGGFGLELGDLDHGPRHGVDGLAVIAINPALFGMDTDSISRFSAAAESLRVDEQGRSDSSVRLPGDGSLARYEKARPNGLEVSKVLWDTIIGWKRVGEGN